MLQMRIFESRPPVAIREPSGWTWTENMERRLELWSVLAGSLWTTQAGLVKWTMADVHSHSVGRLSALLLSALAGNGAGWQQVAETGSSGCNQGTAGDALTKPKRPPQSQPGGQSACQRTLNEFRSTSESRPDAPSFLSPPTIMSDNQPGYRVEYASSSRSKCKGLSLSVFTRINNDVCPRCRPKTMHRCHTPFLYLLDSLIASLFA